MDTPDSTPKRLCRKCNQWHPDTDEYFPRNRGYLCSPCKACKKLYNDKYRAEHPEEIKQRKRDYHQAHKAEIYAKTLAWRADNPERHLEWKRAYYPKHYQDNKARYRDNGREWRKANPEKVKVHDKRWRQNNPEKVAAKFARRRGAPGEHTSGDIVLQYKMQNGNCWWCNKHVGDDYHVDHLIPLSRGGTNNPENLVISCPHCNTSRADRLPYEWSDRLL